MCVHRLTCACCLHLNIVPKCYLYLNFFVKNLFMSKLFYVQNLFVPKYHYSQLYLFCLCLNISFLNFILYLNMACHILVRARYFLPLFIYVFICLCTYYFSDSCLCLNYYLPKFSLCPYIYLQNFNCA